jgi:hypothetical protein
MGDVGPVALDQSLEQIDRAAEARVQVAVPGLDDVADEPFGDLLGLRPLAGIVLVTTLSSSVNLRR